MQDSMQQGQLARTRHTGAASVIAVFAAVLFFAVATAFADPPRPLAASDVTGCCVCRGTNGGTATSLRSCSDGVKVDACVAQCKSQNADSIAFGNQQSCSQGCAGFPTQNLH